MGKVGRPPTMTAAVVEIVADLCAQKGRAVTGAEIASEMEARGLSERTTNPHQALMRARKAGAILGEPVGKQYLYSPAAEAEGE